MNKFFVPVAYLGLIEGVSFAKDAAMKFSKTIATLPIHFFQHGFGDSIGFPPYLVDGLSPGEMPPQWAAVSLASSCCIF